MSKKDGPISIAELSSSKKGVILREGNVDDLSMKWYAVKLHVGWTIRLGSDYFDPVQVTEGHRGRTLPKQDVTDYVEIGDPALELYREDYMPVSYYP